MCYQLQNYGKKGDLGGAFFLIYEGNTVIMYTIFKKKHSNDRYWERDLNLYEALIRIYEPRLETKRGF